jgi:hypothetical protein
MLDRPRADQYFVVTPTASRHLDMGNSATAQTAWGETFRHRIQNGVRSQARRRKGTRAFLDGLAKEKRNA